MPRPHRGGSQARKKRAPAWGAPSGDAASDVPDQLPELIHVLEAAVDRGKAHVRHLVDALELAQSTLIADPMSMPKIKLESDHTVEEGGCIMESSLGTVDAQLRTQFAKMAEKLRTAQKTV